MTSSTTGLCLQGGVKTNGGQPGRLSCAAVDNGFQESDTWTQQVLRPASRVNVATETGADAEITSPNERKIHVH